MTPRGFDVVHAEVLAAVRRLVDRNAVDDQNGDVADRATRAWLAEADAASQADRQQARVALAQDRSAARLALAAAVQRRDECLREVDRAEKNLELHPNPSPPAVHPAGAEGGGTGVDATRQEEQSSGDRLHTEAPEATVTNEERS